MLFAVFLSHANAAVAIGMVASAFSKSVLANALELCPSACWAKHSGILTVFARSAQE